MHSRTLPLQKLCLSALLLLALTGILSLNAQAQRAINDSDRVTLHGNVHPLARAEFDRGSAPASMPMNNMIMLLSIRPDAQAQLDQLLAEQQDPKSPNFHKWLTPAEFGLRFGPTDQDIADASNWLRKFGFKIEQVGSGRMWINFSGNVEKVERAFQTNIRQYAVNGRQHFANAVDPSIPRAFTGLVQGIVSMHNFEKHHNSTVAQLPPDFNNGGTGQHFLAPGDLSVIYNAFPLYNQVPVIDGTGQSIAIVGRTDINIADVRFFRSFFGLPAKDPVFINNGPDPGIVTLPGEETEADLDVEWAGAIAKNATVLFVISQTTATTDGVDLSAQYIVNNNVAPVMSTSFGLCEFTMGTTEQNFWDTLWAQAATQGITSFVSAGDSGAAGCDASNAPSGTQTGINGVASTVNNIAVGGTQFNEGTGNFWNASNNPTDQSSALGYIPENVWNESGNTPGGSGLVATGGGVSLRWTKPSWQFGLGVPADGFRDIPDVSLSAAGHDAYLIVQGHTATNSGLAAVSGTSASSPAFASIMGLVVQKNGAQGNANPVFYSMARNQINGGIGIYHDVTNGNNSVPGIAGFNAQVGYDQASGWGSPDVTQLVNFWNNNAGQPDFRVSAAPPSRIVAQNSSTTFTVSVTGVNNYTGTISFSVTGLPAGATASFAPTSVVNAGTSVLTITTAATTAQGSYPLSIIGNDGTVGHSAQVTLVVGNPDFTLAVSPGSQSVIQGNSVSYTVTQTAVNNYAATVSYSVSGLPTGATATFTPASVAASGTTTLSVSTATTTPAGSYTLTITGTDGTITHTASATLVVSAVDFSLSASPASQSVNQGNSTSYTVTETGINGYVGTVTYSVTAGLPAGATPTFAPASTTGSGTTTLTVATSATTPVGTYTLTISGTDGTLTHTTSVTLVVSAPDFSITASPTSQTINQGNPTSYTVTLNPISGYSGTVTFGLSGQPAGVSFNFAPPTLTGSGSTVLNISTATSTVPGTYPLTINASDGTLTHTVSVTLVVTPAGDFQISTTIASQTVNPGQNAGYGITITSLNGFSGAVALSISGLPSGATATFNPGSVVGAGTSSLAITTSTTTPAGVYNMIVTGTSGSIVHTVGVQLIVNPATPGDFALAASPANLTVKRSNNTTGGVTGTPAKFTITVTPNNGFNGNVALSVSGFPAGVNNIVLSPTTITGGSGSATESFAVSGSAKQGTYSITITGTSGSLVHTTVVNLTIN